MKKVVIVTATYPINNDYGGIFIKDQCRMLKEIGYDVSVLYAAAQPIHRLLNRKAMIDMADEEDFPILIDYSFRFAATYTVPLIRASIVSSCNRLYKQYLSIKHSKPDVIISHFSYPAGIGAAYLSKHYSIPLIAIEHLSLLLRPNARPWINREIKAVYDQASEFVCVSEALKDGVNKRLNVDGKIKVIPNTLDPVFTYHPIPEFTQGYTFLSVGSLREIKNHSLLINSFKTAFLGDVRYQLRIVGEGPQRQELQSLIADNQLEKQVHLVGALDRKSLLKEYELCNCFVLLSKNETFGISYREAMAVGRPVISSNNEGIKSGWDDNFGIIVPTFEEKAVVKALQTMAGKEYNGLDISNRILKQYSAESIGRKYKTLIERVTT